VITRQPLWENRAVSDLPGLLKVLLESVRLWAAAVAVTILGAITFAAKRYGFIDDIPPGYYYLAVGLGLLCGLFALMTLVQSLSALVRARWAARRKRKRREELAHKNLLEASGFERAVLLYYKRENRRRFRISGGQYSTAFASMAQSALIDEDGRGLFDRYYRIPDVIWKMLDNPPAGWAAGALRIADRAWER
jgi:hypothetical protein